VEEKIIINSNGSIWVPRSRVKDALIMLKGLNLENTLAYAALSMVGGSEFVCNMQVEGFLLG